MKNKIDDLRNHLFAELEDLRDPDKKFDAARTNAVIGVAQVIVDSAKAENAFLNAIGASKGTGFIPDGEQLPPAQPQPRLLKSN